MLEHASCRVSLCPVIIVPVVGMLSQVNMHFMVGVQTSPLAIMQFRTIQHI